MAKASAVPLSDGPLGAQRVQGVGRTERPPQQRADPVFFGGRDGEAEVGAAGQGPPHRGRVGLGAAGLPEQARRRLDRRILDAGASPLICSSCRPVPWPPSRAGTIVPGAAASNGGLTRG